MLASERAVFVGRPGGIPVQFSSGPIREINYEGAKAFAVKLPAYLVRLQRRENFRVETPRVKPIVFFGRLPSGELLKLPANDISVSGIGLNADSEPADLAVDMVLARCHFTLPGETQELFVEATIRRIMPREARSGQSLLAGRPAVQRVIERQREPHPALHPSPRARAAAEDNPHDVEMTLAALKKNNVANEIVVVRHGGEALDYPYRREQFANRPPGNPLVIFVDMKMPMVDGLEVLRQVKRDPALKLTPVVMLTSSREEVDLVNSYQLGVNAYVVKPVGFKEFVEAVRQAGMFWAVINEPPPQAVRS